jgi:hypothetical protein
LRPSFTTIDRTACCASAPSMTKVYLPTEQMPIEDRIEQLMAKLSEFP